MASKRALKDDASSLKEKIRTSMANVENPKGDANVRTLRKRLKRAQRKLRAIKRQTEKRNPQKSGSPS